MQETLHRKCCALNLGTYCIYAWDSPSMNRKPECLLLPFTGNLSPDNRRRKQKDLSVPGGSCILTSPSKSLNINSGIKPQKKDIGRWLDASFYFYRPYGTEKKMAMIFATVPKKDRHTSCKRNVGQIV
jgi:hypothetical protein